MHGSINHESLIESNISVPPKRRVLYPCVVIVDNNTLRCSLGPKEVRKKQHERRQQVGYHRQSRLPRTKVEHKAQTERVEGVHGWWSGWERNPDVKKRRDRKTLEGSLYRCQLRAIYGIL